MILSTAHKRSFLGTAHLWTSEGRRDMFTHNNISRKKTITYLIIKIITYHITWGVQVVMYPIFFFSGMEADRNMKVVGGDVAVL